MHRIDRIGVSSIGDIDKPEVTLSFGANFDVKDTTLPVHSCNPINAVAGQHYMTEHWLMDSDPLLADGMQVGFGIFVNYSEIDTELNHVIAVTGIVNFAVNDYDAIRVQAFLGRVNVAQAADTPVVVNTPLEIPLLVNTGFDVVKGEIKASFQDQIVLQHGEDGESDPSNFFDLALYWRISNRSGTTEALQGLEGRLTMWKYHNDLYTCDPNR